MNIQQAKEVPIEEVLRRLGHEPSRQARGQLWYVSPFRDEVTASFKINQARNLWYDFGQAEGGDVIELVQRLAGLSSTSDALKRLAHILGGSVPPPHRGKPPPRADTTSDVEITRIGPLTSRSLMAYLHQRGIAPQLAAPFVQEIHYKRGGKSYFALAFVDDSGGYELRNRHFKGTLGKKDITTLTGDPSRVLVFEGFFDFLTAVTLAGKRPEATVIVLNSVAMRDRAVQAIRSLWPDSVDLYRDRDAAGEELLTFFRQSLPDTQILDQAERYPDHKDLNEWHVGSHSTRWTSRWRG